MKTRIRSKAEFVDKVDMAKQIQKLVHNNESTPQQETIYLVLMDELREFSSYMKSKK